PATFPQVRHSRRDVGPYPVEGGTADVRHARVVVEGGVPGLGARRPSEVVDHDRVDAQPGELFGEALVERGRPADVGEDDHPGSGRSGGLGPPRPVPVTVRGGQDERDPAGPGAAPGGAGGWASYA